MMLPLPKIVFVRFAINTTPGALLAYRRGPPGICLVVIPSIFGIGHDVVEKPPFFMEHGGASVIHINYKSAQVDQVYFPQVEVIGDIALSMDALADCFDLATGFILEEFYQVRDLVRNMTTASLEEISFPE